MLLFLSPCADLNAPDVLESYAGERTSKRSWPSKKERISPSSDSLLGLDFCF